MAHLEPPSAIAAVEFIAGAAPEVAAPAPAVVAGAAGAAASGKYRKNLEGLQGLFDK